VYGSDHPDLLVYRKDFDTKFDFDLWLKRMRRNCDVAQFYEKRVLEVGCGFGWDAVGLALVGGNRVVATDILPSMIDGLQQCLATARTKGHELPIDAKVGDICSLDEADGSFDGIFSSEAIEHVHDLDAMFRRCFALLRPGGKLLILNDSNAYNTEFRESTFKMWKERDTSWEHAEWLKREIRPVEHANARPYKAMRESIIRETGLDLAEGDIASLAEATAGMIATEIAEACKEFKSSGKLPTKPRFSWCRNPETGEYAERLLDPFELRDMLKRAGFRDVRLRHGFTRWPHRWLNGVSFRPLNKFLFDRRGRFVLTATR
jgi:SAM-dependent methyltransferase